MLVTNLTSSLLVLDGYSIGANGQYDLTTAPGPVLFAAWRSNLVSLPTGISLLNNGGTIMIFPPFATGTDTSVEAVLGYTPLPNTTPYVGSFNGRGGTVTLTTTDIGNAFAVDPNLLGNLSLSGSFTANSITASGLTIPLGGNLNLVGSLNATGNATFSAVIVNGALTLNNGLTINGNQITLVNGTSQAAIYTDSGANDIVLRTGAAGSYMYTIHYANGSMYSPGNVSAGGPGGFYAVNNSGLNINDSSGASHLLWHMSTDNYPTWINAMGTHVRVVNQAYNAEIWTCDNGGNMWALGNVTAYSDERFKSEWGDFSSDFVQRLAKVRAGSYTRTDSPSKGLRQVGVGAQSLQPLMPEAVSKNAQGHLTVSYGNAALAAAVYLARHALGLEARIRDLEDRL